MSVKIGNYIIHAPHNGEVKVADVDTGEVLCTDVDTLWTFVERYWCEYKP